jgi:hypothetical protein
MGTHGTCPWTASYIEEMLEDHDCKPLSFPLIHTHTYIPTLQTLILLTLTDYIQTHQLPRLHPFRPIAQG